METYNFGINQHISTYKWFVRCYYLRKSLKKGMIKFQIAIDGCGQELEAEK